MSNIVDPVLQERQKNDSKNEGCEIG